MRDFQLNHSTTSTGNGRTFPEFVNVNGSALLEDAQLMQQVISSTLELACGVALENAENEHWETVETMLTQLIEGESALHNVKANELSTNAFLRSMLETGDFSSLVRSILPHFMTLFKPNKGCSN
jgi:hypothetical protein